MQLRIFLLTLFLLANLPGRAADTTAHYPAHTWVIRGKVLPWIAISTSGVSYSLGAEYGFAYRHAIGIDAAYADNNTGHEVQDTATKQYKPGPRVYSVERSVMVSYRYYFNPCGASWASKGMRRITQDPFLPYLSAFARYAKQDFHYEPGYETRNISHDDWQYSLGLLFGAMTSHIDVNIGPFYKHHYITENQRWQGSTVRNTYMTSNFGLRVGFNVYFVAQRKSSHLLAGF